MLGIRPLIIKFVWLLHGQESSISAGLKVNLRELPLWVVDLFPFWKQVVACRSDWYANGKISLN